MAALASLGDPDFAAGVVRLVEEGRADYEALGRELDITTQASLTNFVPFDFGTGEASDRMLALLDEREVFVRKPGVAPLDRFVRVTVGARAERAGFAEAFRDAVRTMRR
jgi:histidinol-phosphate aminotransferase